EMLLPDCAVAGPVIVGTTIGTISVDCTGLLVGPYTLPAGSLQFSATPKVRINWSAADSRALYCASVSLASCGGIAGTTHALCCVIDCPAPTTNGPTVLTVPSGFVTFTPLCTAVHPPV